MRRTAIAVALAGLIAAPAAFADTTVYGSARSSLNYLDDDAERDGRGKASWRIQNQSSRLGFRGAEDLGRGLSAIYHYEFGVDIAEGAEIGGNGVGGRLSYVGLKGGLGQVSIGRQWNPYYFAVAGEVDVFNGDFSSLGYYRNGGFTRSDRMLYYATPTFFGGLTLYGAGEFDGVNGDSDIDAYQLAAIYDNGPLFIGGGWKRFVKETGVGATDPDTENFEDVGCGVDNSNRKGDNVDFLGISARYNFAFGLNLSASYQHCDNNASGDREVKRGNFDIQGAYRFGNNTLRLGYSWVDEIDDATPDGLGISSDRDNERKFEKLNVINAGYTYRFSRRTRAWVEAGWADYDKGDSDQTNVSIGMRHDF